MSGNVNTQTLLVALPEITLEASDNGNSEQSIKRPLDNVSMCTPPSKKIRSLEDFKSVMSPGKGSGRQEDPHQVEYLCLVLQGHSLLIGKMKT